MRRQGWMGVAAVALTGFALAACGGGASQRQFSRDDQAAIRRLVGDLVAAYNARDSAKAVSLFSGSATMMPPNTSTLHGPDGVKSYYDMRFGQGGTDLQIEVSEISGQGTLAYLTGTYNVRNAPEGGPETRDRGKLLWIVRNMPGNNWRFEAMMWSSDLPPQVPPAPEPAKK